MPTVNELNPKVDLTVRVFDSFNDFEINVPSNEYDIVYSFFSSVFGTNEAADNFTTALFRVAQETGDNVLTLLDQLDANDKVRLTATLSYYLNGIRSPSTLLGINTTVTPNIWAARNVRP